MNKTLLSMALAAVCAVVAWAPQAASAADGTLTFKGNITTVTCDVTGGAGTGGGTGDIIITLPTVGVSTLAAANQTAGATPFSLTIGGTGATGCTNGKIASLNFEPASSPLVNATTGNLKNTTGTGYAQNVEVALVNAATSQPVNLYTSANSPQATIAGNTATLNFIAQYIAVGTAATEGLVDTNVEYSVTYN
ncbi:fimbrial protein [Dyella sp. EPa41]|uniref:fimbrial protein n=1 Tax=Dyella sp. EPa41 TaxID=1561194 RepID=UPI0019155CEA|nr:fimbrial protein [Dyella sp. EPa41]